MYLLPEQLGLEKIIGEIVNLVCVGPYDAQVHFNNGATIQSLYKLEGVINGNKTLWFENQWKDTSGVLRITDEVVSSVVRVSNTELRIELTNNLALCFHTEESEYESLNITYPNGALEIV